MFSVARDAQCQANVPYFLAKMHQVRFPSHMTSGDLDHIRVKFPGGMSEWLRIMAT